MNIAVVGTGISGLAIARLLSKSNNIVLFEKQAVAGGLIKCERVNDCLFHKVGGHVFNAKNKTVLDWFWSHFDKENDFIKANRNAKILYGQNIIGYPIENYLYLLDKKICRQVILEILELKEQIAKSPFEYDNFEDFLINSFGKTLYHFYFEPYNKKIWKTDLQQVAMPWLEGKLPMPNYDEIILNNIVRTEEANMVHSTFYYPKENGSQFIINRFKEGLNIQVNKEISQVNFTDNTIEIESQQFQKMIYCGDIRKLPDNLKQMLREADINVNDIENLKSNGTSNLFCETDETDISWLYIPESFTQAHRIIYTGNFSDTNNRGSQRKTCVVEFSGKVDYNTMVEEAKKLPGNLTPLSYNYEPNSYVIQDHKTREVINAAKQILKTKGIYLLGRFAEWEYYNMDKAIEAAFYLKQTIFAEALITS